MALSPASWGAGGGATPGGSAGGDLTGTYPSPTINLVVVRTNAAPADGTLSAGNAALWFDSTNGAAALNVKAKQADGTVKTATLPVIT